MLPPGPPRLEADSWAGTVEADPIRTGIKRSQHSGASAPPGLTCVARGRMFASSRSEGRVGRTESSAHPWCRRTAVFSFGVACLAAVGVNAAAAATLPNPCALLTKVHAEKTLAKGTSINVTQKKLTNSGSGSLASSTCSETVGKLSVVLSFSHSAGGGSGGIHIVSTTHPRGLGSGDQLVVGTSPSGAPVDFIEFHKSTVYASVYANGAKPSNLTTLARQIYKLVH